MCPDMLSLLKTHYFLCLQVKLMSHLIWLRSLNFSSNYKYVMILIKGKYSLLKHKLVVTMLRKSNNPHTS